MSVVNSVTPDFFPPQIFRDKDGPCPIYTAVFAAVPSIGNLLAAAVAGKCVRVVSGQHGASGAAAGYLTFTSATPGTAKNITNNPPNTIAPVILEFNPGGWFDTNVGEGLYVDVGTAGAYGQVRYIYFTP